MKFLSAILVILMFLSDIFSTVAIRLDSIVTLASSQEVQIYSLKKW